MTPPALIKLNDLESKHISRGPPSSRASSRSATPRNRDASPFQTTNSNLGGNWERLDTPNQTALMSPQIAARGNRPSPADSRRGSSQSARGPGERSISRERSNAQLDVTTPTSARSARSFNSAEKSKAKRSDTPQPRQGLVPQKKSPWRWNGQHDGAAKNCKCPVCAPMDIAAGRVAGLHSGTINLTLSDKLNLTEKPELGEVAPSKPELTAGSKRRGTEVGELIENHVCATDQSKSRPVTGTGKGWGGPKTDLAPRARKTEVGDHLVLAGNEPRPEDADKFEFHLQFKGFKRKKKGYFSRPSHTGLSMQGNLWKERSHLDGQDNRCPAEKEIGWDPEPRGTPRQSYLVDALGPPIVPDGADATYTPRSARSRSSSVRSARGPLQKSLSARDLPVSARMSDTSSARGQRTRRDQDCIVPQVNDRLIGAKYEDVDQDHLYYDSKGDHRGPTNTHFHMSKPATTIRPSLFQSGVGLIENDPRNESKRKEHLINDSDLVCDSYHFEEGMPWMFSKSKGWGERDYIAKRRLRKWGQFSHGPSLRYVLLEERSKPLYRYHRAVSAPPQVSGERHAAALLGSIPILGGECHDSWESWRPAKRGYGPKNNSSREVADAVRNAEIHNYDKNFKKRIQKDPKFAQLCKQTAQMHKDSVQMKKDLRERWHTTSIGALLQPNSH